ncbi:hypothetical protein [Bacillus cereus]|uniref:hypothetical protein n=1 Tax=Bacillus cereus TaxID=1396 RepID=UPI00397EE947
MKKFFLFIFFSVVIIGAVIFFSGDKEKIIAEIESKIPVKLTKEDSKQTKWDKNAEKPEANEEELVEDSWYPENDDEIIAKQIEGKQNDFDNSISHDRNSEYKVIEDIIDKIVLNHINGDGLIPLLESAQSSEYAGSTSLQKVSSNRVKRLNQKYNEKISTLKHSKWKKVQDFQTTLDSLFNTVLETTENPSEEDYEKAKKESDKLIEIYKDMRRETLEEIAKDFAKDGKIIWSHTAAIGAVNRADNIVRDNIALNAAVGLMEYSYHNLNVKTPYPHLDLREPKDVKNLQKIKLDKYINPKEDNDYGKRLIRWGNYFRDIGMLIDKAVNQRDEKARLEAIQKFNLASIEYMNIVGNNPFEKIDEGINWNPENKKWPF